MLKSFILPATKPFVIIIYLQLKTLVFSVYEYEKDFEFSIFTPRRDDDFMGYISTPHSKLGVLLFDSYTVDLDTCVPNPFFKIERKLKEDYWSQGMRGTELDNLILIQGTAMTSECQKDANNFGRDLTKKKPDLLDLELHNVDYIIYKYTALNKYQNETTLLMKMLEAFEKEPMYYFAIFLKDHNGLSPMDYAMIANDFKALTLFVECTLSIENFNISKPVKPYIAQLFMKDIPKTSELLEKC